MKQYIVYIYFLFLFGGCCKAAKPVPPETQRKQLNASWQLLAEYNQSSSSSDAKVSCQSAYNVFLNLEQEGSAMLREKLTSNNRDERFISSAILSNFSSKTETDFLPITNEIIADWKSGTPTGKSGGPAPKWVKQGCQILTRAGFSSTAKAIAESGAYGYWMHECIPLFLYHGLSESSVRKSIVFESELRPNGGMIVSFWGTKGKQVERYLQVMEYEAEELKLQQIVEEYFVEDKTLSDIEVNNLYFALLEMTERMKILSAQTKIKNLLQKHFPSQEDTKATQQNILKWEQELNSIQKTMAVRVANEGKKLIGQESHFGLPAQLESDIYFPLCQ